MFKWCSVVVWSHNVYLLTLTMVFKLDGLIQGQNIKKTCLKRHGVNIGKIQLNEGKNVQGFKCKK